MQKAKKNRYTKNPKKNNIFNLIAKPEQNIKKDQDNGHLILRPKNKTKCNGRGPIKKSHFKYLNFCVIRQTIGHEEKLCVYTPAACPVWRAATTVLPNCTFAEGLLLVIVIVVLSFFFSSFFLSAFYGRVYKRMFVLLRQRRRGHERKMGVTTFLSHNSAVYFFKFLIFLFMPASANINSDDSVALLFSYPIFSVFFFSLHVFRSKCTI